MRNSGISIAMGMMPAILAFLLLFIPPSLSEAQLPVLRDGLSYESPFAVVYEKVAPAVVRIDIQIERRRRTSSEQTPQSPRDFFLDNPQQFQRRPRSGMGSGIIVDREGHIITNNHVIENATTITVRVNEQDEYDAEVVGRDPDTDLAVIRLKLEGELLPLENVAELGNSDSLRPGDYAVAIGNPLGLERTITVGVISALNRYDLENPIGASGLQYKDFIQTDAQINPGNSGGALADIDGRVIGINNMYAAENAGIGFAIPINLARKVMRQIIDTGIVKRGFVGLNGSDIDREDRRTLDLPGSTGFMVDNVEKGYPAENAGLLTGDIVISVNGINIRSYNDWLFKIADHMPGDVITIEFIRDGEMKAVQLTLEDRDTYFLALEELDSNSWRGINVVDLDSPLARNFQVEGFRRGVLIVSIDPGSPAAEEGSRLSEGDVIIEINGQSIDNVADFLAVKEEISDSELAERVILIYRQRLMTSGRISGGNVTINAE